LLERVRKLKTNGTMSNGDVDMTEMDGPLHFCHRCHTTAADELKERLRTPTPPPVQAPPPPPPPVMQTAPPLPPLIQSGLPAHLQHIVHQIPAQLENIPPQLAVPHGIPIAVSRGMIFPPPLAPLP